MKKIIALTILGSAFTTSIWATKLPLTIEGKEVGSGIPCFLTIEKWGFHAEHPQDWYVLEVVAHSNYQLVENPSILLTKSSTQWALYGRSSENYDRMALFLRPGSLEPEVSIESYEFQSWDETRKLIQAKCRF